MGQAMVLNSLALPTMGVSEKQQDLVRGRSDINFLRLVARGKWKDEFHYIRRKSEESIPP
jgi:hypothetical protein